MSTKKLAKELGLVRKRSQSSNGQKKPLVSNQIFSYMIVIDFESTCWREKNSYGQEIIEFPAVLLNTSTGEIESEFHTYVQPQEHPILSEFCTELTGITQTQVEAGVPLHICLSRFNRWLQTLQLKRDVVFPKDQRGSAAATGHPCAFVTWSDWDLGVCLLYECKRKQLHKPDVLNSWIDLRATYRLFYNRKPKGLNGALQDLGIQFSGREHSGLDDARNTAHLAWRMMTDGCVMKVTRCMERASVKTKTLFGNAAGNGHLSHKTANNDIKEKATIKSLSKTTTPSHPETQSKLSENKPDPNTEVNLNVETCNYQSLVSPKTVLIGLTTPLCGSNRSVRIGTLTNCKQSPMVIPFPHNITNNSLVLVPTTVNCITHLPQSDLISEPEVGGWEEEMPILVETEECGSYDDVALEDDVCTEKEQFMVDETLIYGRTLVDIWKDAKPMQSNLVKGPTRRRPSSDTSKTTCLPSLEQREAALVSSNNTVSLKAETKTTSNVSKVSFARPKPVIRDSTPLASHSRMYTATTSSYSLKKLKDMSRTTLNTSVANTFARPKPVIRDSTPLASHSRMYTATTSSYSLKKLKDMLANTFARPKPVIRDSTPLASHSRMYTATTSSYSLKIYQDMLANTFARPKPVIHGNPLATCSRLHMEAPGQSFMIYKDKSRTTSNTTTPNAPFARPKAVGHPKPLATSSRLNTTTQKHPSKERSRHSTSVSCPSSGALFSVPPSFSVNQSSFPPRGGARITSPLCGCGRRAKRQTVANNGPNHGRVFYCCPVRKSGPGNRKGCEFFKWESALLKTKSPAAASSISLCFNSSLRLPSFLSRKSY